MFIIIAYWIGFNQYCNQRFEYCYLQVYSDNPECGVYFIDRWSPSFIDYITDFGMSFIECEGVLD